ncbi:MAG: hypothetical protein LBK27_05730 [Treponema sp.]|jgi:hypothetical protein|nr:hypothetical protein [Treponema sp.]
MSIRYAVPALAILLGSSFLLSCGELDAVFPSSGTYQVDALVNKELSLSKSSLISKGDKIYPYFASPVSGDPDVRGLAVFLQTPAGQTAGARIRYTLKTGTAAKTEEQTSSRQDVPAEILVSVNTMDKDLPSFSLPETLEAGPYIMVYQVLGEDSVLFRDEKNVYYLKDAKFSLDKIRTYLPGVSASPLIPQGIVVMLEAQVDSDERLDPYIIWYSGKKRISEGYAVRGSGRILWNAPEEVGFQTIRAELLPQGPVSNFAGKFTEISLPVAAAAHIPGAFSGDPDQIAWRYELQGDLKDSQAPDSAVRELVFRGTKKNPQWMPGDTVYGLGTGAGDVYALSAFSFAAPEDQAEKTEQAGRFMLRFQPVEAGPVFGIRLDSVPPAGPVFLNLSFSGEDLSLEITTPEKSESVFLDYSPGETESFVSLFIDFAAGNGFFEARLSRENSRQPPARSRKLAILSPLMGTGSLQLGAPLGQAVPGQKADEPQAEQSFPISAIFDEFALVRGNHVPRIEMEAEKVSPKPDTEEAALLEAESVKPPRSEEETPEPQNLS